jgi:heat shock protein HspQ
MTAAEFPAGGRRMEKIRTAKFQLGQVVRHRFYPFRGVIFDIDPEFDNDEEWWQNLLPDDSGEPVRHPQVIEFFDNLENGVYRLRYTQDH